MNQSSNRSALRSLSAALAIGASAFALPQAAHANGDIDFELVAAFAENFDRFESELVLMGEVTDKVYATYANGGEFQPAFDAWVEAWESVGFHGVVETKAPYLYPPVWVGIYEMKGVADAKGPAEDMKKAGEKTKAALWQGLGGLRVLAANPDADTTSIPAAHDHGHDHHGIDPQEQPIEAILAELNEAVEAYAAGDVEKAGKIVFDAYMEIFEHLEGDLIEADADLVTALELEFNAGLPSIFKKGGSVEDAKAKVEDMSKSLIAAKKLLAEIAAKRSSVF